MSRVAGAVVATLLLGCSVDTADLRGFPDACDVRGQCAEGYTCEDARCVLAPGAACEETAPAVACELRQGVCAEAARACVDGQVEQQCTAASYGPHYESRESRCDGVDNDCDGIADAQLWPLGSPQGLLISHLLPRDGGLAAVTLELSGAFERTWALRYDALGEDFAWAGERLQLQGPVRSDDGVGIRTSAGPGEAVVLWQPLPRTGTAPAQLVRVQHAPGTAPVLAAGPVELSPPPQAQGVPRIALAADGTSVLVAWATLEGVHLQRLSPGLTPLEEPVLMSPAPSHPPGTFAPVLDVAPRGPSGFLVGWSSPAVTGSTVHLRAFPGEGLRTLEAAGEVRELRLLRAPDGTGTRAAWLQRSSAGSSAVDWVEPFGTALPSRALELQGEALTRLDASLAPGGSLLLTYPRGEAGKLDVVLRSVSPAGPVHEQLLGSRVPLWATQLIGAGADRRVVATTLSEGRSFALRTCALP